MAEKDRRAGPKFIVLGSMRTGTTVLRRALNSHSHLDVEDELFNWEDPSCTETRQRLASGIYSPGQLRKLSADSDLIPLLNAIFERFDGFKIQTDFAQIARSNPAWIYLLGLRGLTILRVKRRNKLRQVLSLQAAKTSNVWHLETGESADPADLRVQLPPSRTVKQLEALEQQERYFDSLTVNTNFFEIFYEDLESDIQRVLAYVQGALGLPCEELEIPTRKIITGPLADSIKNYSQLSAALEATRWESMLD